MGDLTANFNRKEFDCKCGCGANKIDSAFLWELQLCREVADIPFTITSGCRCPKHNEAVGGFSTSDHITDEDHHCSGADIKCVDSKARCKIVDAAFQVGFDRIGIAKTFIHLGRSSTNTRRVLWLY